MKRVRIITNGTPVGTKVIDIETGAEIFVSEIDFHIDFRGGTECKLTLPPTYTLRAELDAKLQRLGS